MIQGNWIGRLFSRVTIPRYQRRQMERPGVLKKKPVVAKRQEEVKESCKHKKTVQWRALWSYRDCHSCPYHQIRVKPTFVTEVVQPRAGKMKLTFGI